MTQEAKYRISLIDLFTKPIQSAAAASQHFSDSVDKAKRHTEGLESSFHSLEGTLAKIGLGFSAFEIGKKSIESVIEYNTGLGQLQAGLKSTKGASGETMEALIEQSEKLEKTGLFEKTDIMNNLESILLTFPKVTKNVFNRASEDILDTATKLHKGLQETTMMVGKALQDPIHGLTMLRRAGVNFSDSQEKVIKNLFATGQAAKAQGMILAELETETKGAALAARKANPFAAMKNDLADLSISIGQRLLPVIDSLIPSIQNLFGIIIKGLEWIDNHHGIIKAIAVGILAWKAATIVQTAAQWALNVALDANPIGLIIIGVAALTAGLYYLYENSEPVRDVMNSIGNEFSKIGEAFSKMSSEMHGSDLIGFFTGLADILENRVVSILKIVSDTLKGAGEIISGIANKDWLMVAKGLGHSLINAATLGPRMGGSLVADVYNGATDDPLGLHGHNIKSNQGGLSVPFSSMMAGFLNNGNGKEPNTLPETSNPAGSGTSSLDSGVDTISGNRPQNLIINIQDLIKTLNINTTNMQEGGREIKELVTRYINEAIADLQIAGQGT